MLRNKDVLELENKKKQLNKELEIVMRELKEIGYSYEDFFNNLQTDFIIYKLPVVQQLIAYLKYVGPKAYNNNSGEPFHPLDNFWSGYKNDDENDSLFNFAELAMFIKCIYEFKTDKEHEIVTIGNMVAPGWACNVYPKIHYVVGEKGKIDKYKKHDGKFYEELDKFSFEKPTKGLIAFSQTANHRTFDNPYPIDIPSDSSVGRKMKYMEYKTVGEEATAYFSKYEDIFKRNLQYYCIRDQIKSHRDILKVNISRGDNFISDIIYSIMMYKKANFIEYLTDKDYAYIIDVLYKSKIEPISEQVDKSIPKELIYVKDDSVRKRFKDHRLAHNDI